jgi:hypothetical protein
MTAILIAFVVGAIAGAVGYHFVRAKNPTVQL